MGESQRELLLKSGPDPFPLNTQKVMETTIKRK